MPWAVLNAVLGMSTGSINTGLYPAVRSILENILAPANLLNSSSINGSEYLFLMVAEGLSCMINGAEDRGDLEDVRVCRQAPVVSHLLFEDDSLILMHADKNADCLNGILNKYYVNSGQKNQ